MSPTAVQGRADIRMRVAMPLDYEHIRSYSFSVSYVFLQASERLYGNIYTSEFYNGFISLRLWN